MNTKEFEFIGDVKSWSVDGYNSIDTLYFEKVINEFIRNNDITNYTVKEVSCIHNEGKCKVIMRLTWNDKNKDFQKKDVISVLNDLKSEVVPRLSLETGQIIPDMNEEETKNITFNV